MTEYPEWLASTLASDAAEGRGALPNGVAPLVVDARVIAPARVALMSQDDNLAVREAIEQPVPGAVLVVGGGGMSRTATIGGLMARELRQAGYVGLVTDGLVRDAREIRALGFAVWCRGVTPAASGKGGPAVLGGSVAIGGTVVREGDLIIADEDGVVVWPSERIAELLARAEAKLRQDNARLAQLLAAESHGAEM